MDKNIGVLCIGGDQRLAVAEHTINELGWKTSLCLNSKTAKRNKFGVWQDAIVKNKIIIFPLPMSRERIYLNCADDKILLSDIIYYIPKDAFVLGGSIPEEICDLLREKGISFVDYYTDELKIANALPTAEGAIGIAIREMPILLSGSNSLVVGYGRIGKILAHKLQLLGSKVTVGARKETDLAFAKANSHEIISIASGIPHNRLFDFDVIFNTVPVCLFNQKTLSFFNKKTLYIELASFPYGIDKAAAEECSVHVIMAEALPGKYSPISAGQILADHVVRILSKEDIMP